MAKVRQEKRALESRQKNLQLVAQGTRREKEEIEAETAPLRLAHSQPMEAEEVPEVSPHLGTTRASPQGALVKADQAC